MLRAIAAGSEEEKNAPELVLSKAALVERHPTTCGTKIVLLSSRWCEWHLTVGDRQQPSQTVNVWQTLPGDKFGMLATVRRARCHKINKEAGTQCTSNSKVFNTIART